MTITSRYPGSRSFQDSDLDRLLFFGRSDEKKILLHLILAKDLVLLFAKSGVGKTSLLNAVILKELRDRKYCPIHLRLNNVDKDPIASIQDQVLERAKKYLETETVELKDREQHLWLFFYNFSKLLKENFSLTPVLIFDQFEELFTLNTQEQQRRFISQFADLVRKSVPATLQDERENITYERLPPLKIVLSMREDYLGEMERVAAQAPQVMHNRFRLTKLTRAQAKKAIEEPAATPDPKIAHQSLASRSFKYASKAIEDMLDYLMDRHEGEDQFGATDVEPFQLQILCQDLEKRVQKLQKTQPGPITISREELGGKKGMKKSLRDYYVQQVHDFPEEEQNAVRLLCVILISPNRKYRLSLEENYIKNRIAEHHKKVNVQPMLEELVKRRLLRKEPRLRSFYYELSHDSLIEVIIDEEMPDKIFKNAEHQRRLGKYQEALEGYERTIELDASHTSAYSSWVSLLMDLGKGKQAAEVLQKRIDNSPENATLYHLRGKISAKLGDYKEAIEFYKKALELNDRLVAVYTDLGNAYRQDNQDEEAFKAYEKARALDGQNPKVYRQLALFSIAKGKFEQAIEYFKQAVKADPDFGYILFEDLVKKLKDQNAEQDARELCQLALEVKSESSRFFFRIGNLARELSLLGAYEIAIAAYLKGIELSPDHSVYNTLGWTYLLNNNLESAQAQFEESIRLNPKYYSPVLNLGLIYALQDQMDEARQSWRKGLELLELYRQHSPSLWDRATRALFVLALGEPEEGIAEMQTVIKEGASKKALQNALGDAEVLARCRRKPENIDQIVEILREAIGQSK